MTYNEGDLVRRALIVQLLKEMDLDGEEMQSIIVEVGFVPLHHTK